MNNLKIKYQSEIVPKLQEHFNYKNIHQVPKLEKICINIGLGLKAQNKNCLQKTINELRLITGQHPALTKAKNSIANFKLRQDVPLGLIVTLRKVKMYAFLERLIVLALPCIRDFNGLNPKSFDKQGNYNFGITDHSIFPELSFDTLDERRGLNITIVTTAKSSGESLFLLTLLGLPFFKASQTSVINK